MRINKCWFCSANIYPGHGVTFVRNDSTVFNFCRSKCHRLFKRRLNPRKIKWTQAARVLNKKEIRTDEIHKFERKMDIPIIYSRDIVKKTVLAIPKIIQRRYLVESRYIADRILSGHEEGKEECLRFIERHKDLLDRPDIMDPRLKKFIERTEKKSSTRKEKEVAFN